MKQEISHPEPETGELTGPRYWRSLNEWADKPEFKEWLHREFPEGASESEGLDRRGFLKIMSASFALAGLGAAGCRRPEQYILPYSKQPENAIPGIPVYYSSAFPAGKEHLPVVVETHQHRPTHIEGNRAYAPYGGAINAFASASVLNLYDPDRMTSSYEGQRRIGKDRVADLIAGVHSKFKPVEGQGLAILAEPSSSPSRERLKKEFLNKFPRAVWAEYTPVERSNPEKALKKVYGQSLRPLPQLAKAKRILALEADFLSKQSGALGLARDFAKGRKVKDKADAKKMNRLYTVESAFTVTGAMADHRLRLPHLHQAAFTAKLVSRVIELAGGDADLANVLRDRAGEVAVDAAWIDACAEDLVSHRGASVILAGEDLPVEVQALVIYANELLGAPGQTLRYVELADSESDSIDALAARIGRKEVESLFILGGNPVYNAPASLNWRKLQKSVREVIRYGYYFDETSLEAGINIAATHFLETWGDGRTLDGSFVPVQPMLQPLFDGYQQLEVLARLTGANLTDTYSIVAATYAQVSGKGSSRQAFDKMLSEGFDGAAAYRTAAFQAPVRSVKSFVAQADFSAPKVGAGNLEIRLVEDDSVGDGFYANNGWLQECPDPMTKLTWDNAILISPKLAEKLGFDTKSGEFAIGGVVKKNANFKRGREVSPIAELTLGDRKVKAPVHIQPGLADWTVILPLGYGREQVGRVGKGSGTNFYPFLDKASAPARAGATLSLTGETFNLANTQEHWSMEGRAIMREASAKTHYENPEWVSQMGMESHSPPIYGADKDMPLSQKALETPRGGSAYETPDFGKPPPNVDVWKDEEAREQFIPEQQWGMSIDLNTCTGCNACIIACQSENNIPIVGKDQIMRGREMHWIRLDRYYSSGDLETSQTSLPHDPQASLMPVGCLHCEMAPCEQVCPVNATVHDRQGLNVMAYNRCVGTRYCANNCPYKVRRFNFFDYNKRATDEFYKGPIGENQYKTEGGELAALQKNPDVTVRMRGVMEKCTYCVQRIEQAKIAQRVKAKDSNDIKVPDGIIRTACQSACPTEAITFGDISDETTRVYEAKQNDRDYALLGYLNTRPRTTYLARLRNPNPKMPDYERIAKPFTYSEYKSKQANAGKEQGHGDGHGD